MKKKKKILRNAFNCVEHGSEFRGIFAAFAGAIEIFCLCQIMSSIRDTPKWIGIANRDVIPCNVSEHRVEFFKFCFAFKRGKNRVFFLKNSEKYAQ